MPPLGGSRRGLPASATGTEQSPSVSQHQSLSGSQYGGSQSGRRGPSQYDGPGSHGSQEGGHGRRGSQSSGGFAAALGQQPLHPRPTIAIDKNLDPGPEAYLLLNDYDAPKANMLRPGMATAGKEIQLKLNAHRVLSYPSMTVYQYDVVIGNGDEKRGLNAAVWNSKEATKQLGGQWIYDGAKLAWNGRKLGQCTFQVDMDIEKGREPNPNRPNKFRVQIRETKALGLQGLQAYMQGKADFTTECLEAISFIDHLMRELPQRRLISIKRSFFSNGLKDSASMGAGVLAARGVYQSLRPAMGGLVVNADVANQCFWEEASIYSACLSLAAPVLENNVIQRMQKPGPGQETVMYKQVQKLKKVRFTVEYRNMPEKMVGKVFVIAEVLRINARDAKFEMKNRQTGESQVISVFDYFLKQYSVRLEHPNMPVIRATGKHGAMFPMELCNLTKGQKYPFKLSDIQTANMIRFAVTRPPQRAQANEQGRAMLNWAGDPALKMYQLKISQDMLQTKARLLQPPNVEFAGGKAEKPGTSGRWRTDGKQFVQSNPDVLSCWSVMIFNDWGTERDKVSPPEVTKFNAEFAKLFKAHGGKLKSDKPTTMMAGNVNNIAASVNELWNKSKAEGHMEPQLLIFIVTAKNAMHYNRLKRQCDNRFGCVSQVMQSSHIKKCQPQYISNVLLKVFAKLGGFGFRASPAAGKLGTPYPWFDRPTMIVGADVSHGAAGSTQCSIASLTCSMDKIGTRYWGMVQSNGQREEMVTTWNIFDMLVPAFREWMSTVGGGNFPKHFIYFRDGVSEGQHQHVLQREVRDMKAVWEKLDQTPDKRFAKQVQFTVIICSKRHHIRFFPGPGVGDKNGNALPGTLVERDVTNPREYDFYLCSHSAIQGTARPVHYHVLMDELKMPVDKLVGMIYNHSYQYARSTTPVSIFPAIYYAHLAAKRAVAHDRAFGEDPGEFSHTPTDKRDLVELQAARLACDRTGKIMTESARERLANLERKENPTLLPLGPAAPAPPKADEKAPPSQRGDPRRFKWSMWYI